MNFSSVASKRRVLRRQSRWIVIPLEELNDDPIPWSEICGCECIARLLFRKGFHTADEVQAFLQPRLKSLSDPCLLPNMEAAVTRIFTPLAHHERIVLCSGYTGARAKSSS